MDEGEGFQTKRTPVCEDYDSDETVIDESIPGSDEGEDELYLKRMLIQSDAYPTCAASLFPNTSNNGQQSPEIHLISKLIQATQMESNGTAIKQISEEEPSQSLLRNWGKKSRVLPTENTHCQLMKNFNDLCEDSQQLFDSLELEENIIANESQNTSLLPALVTCPENKMVSLDNNETVNVQNTDHNVSNTRNNGEINLFIEEPQSRRQVDFMSIDNMLKFFYASDSLTQLLEIGDLSFLETPEDGSGQLNTTALLNPPVQSSRDGLIIEEDHCDRQAMGEFSDNHTQIPGVLCTDEIGKRKKEENTEKTDEETREETLVTEERTIVTTLLSSGSFPSDGSNLLNVEKQSVTQNSLQESNKKSTITKDDSENISCTDISQTSLPLHEHVKQPPEVSKTAISVSDTINEKQSTAGTAKQKMNQHRKQLRIYSKTQQDPLCTKNKNQRPCYGCDAESSTQGRNNIRKSSTERTLKRKSNINQPREHEKKSTKENELALSEKICFETLGNGASSGEREKRKDPATPVVCQSSQLNSIESVQHCKSSHTSRNIHKRDFMGETLLHKACRKGDLELVNSLIAAGINVNQQDNAGWAAIHEASCKGYSEVILALIEAGADINCKGLEGILPLHDAVYGNHFKAVDILLKFGANPLETDENMKNAFDKCCSENMEKILTSHCGQLDKPTIHATDHIKEPCPTITPSLTSSACRSGDEILNTLHDIESKQKKLLSKEASENSEKCVKELNEIENVLNDIVNLQNTERDSLVKKYRASAESFNQGILRDKMAKLASNQKTLLQVVRNQKEATLKIKALQQSQRSNANNGETSSNLHDTSPQRNQISALCAANEWLEANFTNGSTMATKMPAVDEMPDIESNQPDRTISRCNSGSEIRRTAEPPTASPISEDEHILQPLSSDSCSVILNKSLDSKVPGNKSNSLTYVNISSNITEKAASVKQKCKETDRTRKTFPLKKLMKLGKLKPGVDVLSFQLQVTEILKDYSHKATLLCDGQVIDSSGVVFRGPVQWVKAILGDNISVTWKYVSDKVNYIEKKLSSFIEQEDLSKTLGEPDPERPELPRLQPPGHAVLQVNEILLVDRSEFFPRHIMDKYWQEFMNGDIQDY
ncbi:ankyrin repeat domain-containing protein 31 isoform X2 [Engystomops pustulosus]|uniref:ankyrin repeat domain-containing protein 31 isoform X2 n=1 Tax=Engystomops pustulosus TaxID=76066 RepID=UPI003AFB6303